MHCQLQRVGVTNGQNYRPSFLLHMLTDAVQSDQTYFQNQNASNFCCHIFNELCININFFLPNPNVFMIFLSAIYMDTRIASFAKICKCQLVPNLKHIIKYLNLI